MNLLSGFRQRGSHSFLVSMTDPQHNERIHKEPLNSAELGLFRQEQEKKLTHGNRERSVMTARLDQMSGRGEESEGEDNENMDGHDGDNMFYGGSGETIAPENTKRDEDPVADTSRTVDPDPPKPIVGSAHIWVGVAVGIIIAFVAIFLFLLKQRKLRAILDSTSS